MKPYVITISRQFASMGRTIAQLMAKELNINFYDRDIVAETARRLGLMKKDISDYDEQAHEGFFMRKNYLFRFSSYSIRDEIFETQKNVILDFVSKGSCIIVGRCADSILRDHPNALHVYVYAPFEKRLDNCINKLMMEKKDAINALKKVDTARLAYRRIYCPDCKSDFDDRDLMIDSSRFGEELTAKLLVDMVKNTLAKEQIFIDKKKDLISPFSYHCFEFFYFILKISNYF